MSAHYGYVCSLTILATIAVTLFIIWVLACSHTAAGCF
jgi:hypothetical protein